MSETVKVEVDLDLDPKLAKKKLEDFKEVAEKDDIKIKLDIENAKGEALKLKNVLTDAFKIDTKSLGNLKQVEDTLKQINKLIKVQSDLGKKNTDNNLDLTSNIDKTLRDMNKIVQLSGLVNKSINKNTLDGGDIGKISSSIKEYLSVSKKIDDTIAKIYKAENSGQKETIESLKKELSLLETKRKELEKLVDINSDYIKKERELAQASAITSMSKQDDKDNLNRLKQQQNELKSLINTYEQYEKELTKLKITQNELRYQGKDGEANALDSQISKLEELKNALKSVNYEKFGTELYSELEKIENKYREVARTAEELSRGKYDDANTIKLNKAYQELDKIEDKLKTMQNTKGFLDNDLIEKTNSLLSKTREQLDANGIGVDLDKINNSVNELNGNLKQLSLGNTLGKQEANFNVSLESMRNKIEQLKDSIKDLAGSDDMIKRLDSAFNSIDTDNIERATIQLKECRQVVSQVEKEARQLQSAMDGRSFFGNFGQEFRDNLFTFTAGELLADGIRNVGNSLKTLVMEYDAAMTNLKKVANPEDIMNIDQLDNIGRKANEIAKNVGQSTQDTIQAIADTIQMAGLGMEESIKVAEQTMKLANVTEMSTQAASEGVVTMLASFNLDPLKEIPIVVEGVAKSTNEMVNSFDVLNHVGNNFSISSDGLLDAIQSGANVLATYGVSLNDTVAMITAANSSLQDTSRVGNGLKTIQLRLAGIKSSAKDGTLSLNKTALALKEVAGIDIFEEGSKTDIKDMATLIEEIGEKWDSLNEKQRAGLSEAIAGAEQATVFQSLMSNLDTMKKVQQELANGEHYQSMEKENARYVDSIAGQLNKLKETWVGIFNTISNSDAIKTIIKGLVSISEAIAKVITTLDEIGMLTPVLVGLGTVLASKAFSGIGSIFQSGTKEAKGFASILHGITKGFTSMNPPASKFGATLVGMGTNIALAGTKLGGLLATASTFVPWAVAAGVAVYGTAKAIDYFTESLDEEKQRLNESIATRKENISSMESQKSKLQEIQKEYDKLANKTKKNSSEVERLTQLTNEIAQIRPDLVVGTDENGNAILSMTGDVKDLISEMDRAVESKKRLLNVEQEDSAKNSIKQLHGEKHYSNVTGYTYTSDSEMSKLESITQKHISNMSKLEKDRDKIINDLYGATGKERTKLLKDLDKANYEIEKAQEEFVQSYQTQLDVIKEYSDGIGESLFGNIERSSSFKNASEELQNQFSELRQHLDFSDIKTEDQLLEAEYALNKLFKAAKNGDIDLGKLKSQLEKANKEFAKTQDSEKYAQSMEKIIEQIKEIPGLENINVDLLKDMFEGIDTSVTKGKDALDEFLRAYGKTKADLEKDDGFAKALAEQKRQLEDALNNLEITGKPEVDIEIAYDMLANKDLPEQLRDMIRTMINSGVDGTKILHVTQEILLDIQDGKIDNPEKLQKMIDDAFGEYGHFEITPEILMNDNTKVAGVERVIEQIKEKFGEIPPVVKTIIEADGITAFSEARKLTEMYNGIPKEIRTIMSNNGLETSQDIQLVDLMLKGLPSEIVSKILTNCPEVVEDAEDLKGVINNLPASILMEIKNNYPEVVEKSQLLQEAIANIPATKESKVSIQEEIKKDPMSLLDRLFGKNKTEMTATAIINSQVNNLNALKEFNDVWNNITGGGKSSGSSSSSSNEKGRSIEESPLNQFSDDIALASANTKGASVGSGGGSSFDAVINVTVNGMDSLQQLQTTMDNFELKNVSATVTIHTALAAQNISGLLVRIGQVKTAIDGIKGKTIQIATAQSAKNLSGLITRVNQYRDAINNTPDKTANVHTVIYAAYIEKSI